MIEREYEGIRTNRVADLVYTLTVQGMGAAPAKKSAHSRDEIELPREPTAEMKRVPVATGRPFCGSSSCRMVSSDYLKEARSCSSAVRLPFGSGSASGARARVHQEGD